MAGASPAPISRPGAGSWQPVSMPSSSTRPAAARRSRTTAISPTATPHGGSPRSRATSANCCTTSACATARAKPYRVAYHDACSLQHGQRVTRPATGSCWPRRFPGARRTARAFLLRLGRHLQPAAARYGGGARPTQGRATSTASIPTSSRPAISAAWCSSRAITSVPRRAHGRTARLGDRRAAAARPRGPASARAGCACRHGTAARCSGRIAADQRPRPNGHLVNDPARPATQRVLR